MNLTYKKCGSAALRKNGSLKGQPNYKFMACRHQAVFKPAAARKAAQYAQVEKLLVERVSQRAIVRLTGVSCSTIVKLAKKAQTAPRSRRPPSLPWMLELDKMWPFVSRKKHKVCFWLALESYTRRIVAWVLGTRGKATTRRLWQARPVDYCLGTWHYTDEWEAYRRVLSPNAHRASTKGSGHTSIVEAVNCSLRQKCAVLVRKI